MIEIIDADEHTLAKQQASALAESREERQKELALAEVSDSLAKTGIDILYLIDKYKEAAETAMMEGYSGAVYEDQKTRITALNKLVDLWKIANKINTRDPVVIQFKPIFDKPSTLY